MSECVQHVLCLQILLSNPHMWWLRDSDSENNSQENPSQENIEQVSDSAVGLPDLCTPSGGEGW